MMTIVYIILGFFGLGILVYTLSKVQMRAWIHVVEEHFDSKLLNKFSTKIKQDDTEKE